MVAASPGAHGAVSPHTGALSPVARPSAPGCSKGVKQSLCVFCRYFHCYRIDHILGFFRIWEIPGDCSSGILGHFRPSIPLSRHVSRRPMRSPPL